ncbi:MAG: hypothetical protein NWE86_08425 [Candidatus Bathyarchaeota archaeon]|nr:hypothetical protein [Candidatus Bathyarchaeota archaeon]
MVNHPFKVGFSFGVTSGIITTLGLMVGLHSGTQSKFVVIGGILIIAIADAFSDAFGIHVSEESENKHDSKEIWASTIYTFLSKFLFALSFIIPVIFLDLTIAIVLSVIWGLLVLSILSLNIAKEQRKKPWKVILEHLTITLLVIIITHFVGDWIYSTFGFL